MFDYWWQIYLELLDNTQQMHCQTFRPDKRTLGYDLLLCILRFVHKLRYMDRSICCERKLCLTGNLDFVRIRVDMRYKDHRDTRVDRYRCHHGTPRWLRMGMDYKDLVVQLQILLFILNKYDILKTKC